MPAPSLRRHPGLPWCALLLVLSAAALAATGCAKKSSNTGSAAPGAAGSAAAPSASAANRFGKSSGLLIDALSKPTDAFHFSYKGQTNINNEYPMQAGSKPRVGPVSVEADISPTEVAITSTRGEKKSEAKALRSSDLDWSMASLSLIGPVGETGIVMAFASPVAHVTGTEAVNGCQADKYEFDTNTATAEQRAAFEAVKGMLQGREEFGSIRGAAWVDQASGRLVKFNFDAEVHDKAGNSYTEHHEGEVRPKK